MSVLGEFFGFDGRIDRIGYASRCAVATTVLWTLGAAGKRVLSFALGDNGLFGIRTWPEWGADGLLLLAAWAGLGLASRRLRDIGLEPAWVVPAYGFLVSAGVGTGEPWLRIAPPPYDSIGAVALLLPSLTAVPLVVWPSRRPPPPAPPIVDPGVHTAYVNWRAVARLDGPGDRPQQGAPWPTPRRPNSSRSAAPSTTSTRR